jgi:integrase
MKSQRLRIADYNHSATTPYVLEGFRVNGKRKRLFFRTKQEAELALARLKLIQRREGDQASELGAEGRIEAVRCNERLTKFGKTITDATDFFIAHLEQEERARATLSVDNLAALRLESLARIGRSDRHIKDIRIHLGRFAQTFGSRPAGSITAEEIESWLETLSVGPLTCNNYLDRVSTMFAFGVKRGLLTDNPLERIERKTLKPSPTQVIAPTDLQRLLDGAPTELVPVLSISFFAGLRTAEIQRLSWDDVHLDRRFIEIAAAKAKSAKRRLVPIEPNLLEWLRPFAGIRSGPICRESERTLHNMIGRLYDDLGIKRLQNAGRHSFASYWLAQHTDSAALASRLGHPNSNLVFSTYRELVTPEVAEAYWSIRPSSVPSNVVAIA